MTANNALPPTVIETIAGVSAGVASTLAVHPLDVIKTRLQLNAQSTFRVGGSLRVAREILRDEGSVRGLYRGFVPNVVGNAAAWGFYFLWYGKIKNIFARSQHPPNGELSYVQYFAASAAAGTLTAFCTNPIWVIKTRMLASGSNAPGAYSGVVDGVRQIFRHEGISGFYRGMVPALFGVSHGAVQFMVYEKLKHRQLRGKGETKLRNLDALWVSGSSKIIAGVVTYPYQVIRSRLQTYSASKDYAGTVDVISKTIRTEGLVGLYKGLVPNMVRVLPSVWVTFLVYENVRFYLPWMISSDHKI